MNRLILLVLFLCFFAHGSNCYSYQDTFVNDNLSAEIRGQIFSPDRQNIHLVNVDVPTAVKEIQKVFNWEPRDIKSIECCSYPFVKDVRVTIDRKNISMAEAFADLCNQTGFTVFDNYSSIGISGAIGSEKVGGRNFAFASDGILLLLSFSLVSKQHQISIPDSYAIWPRVINSPTWSGERNARIIINELIYPNGTRLENINQIYQTDVQIPSDMLFVNQGKIQSIKGKLSILLPVSVVTENINLLEEINMPIIKNANNHFISINKLIKIEKGWLLEYTIGEKYKKIENIRFDYGNVEAIDDNGNLINNFYSHYGTGGEYGNATSRSYRSYEVKLTKRPKIIQWKYINKTEEYFIPFHFHDCQVPEIVWKKSITR